MEIVIWNWESDGNQGGKYNKGHTNKDTEILLENFAKTKEGYAFLSLYAAKGQKIGSVEFTEDGIYSNHDLNIIEYSTYNSRAGILLFRRGKNNMQFDIYLSIPSQNKDLGKESYAITIGHEIFLHMDRIDDKLITAYNTGNKAEYDKVVKECSKGGGDIDHKDYINGKWGSRFNRYVSQLKNIMNSVNVGKAKRKHDNKYLYLRNKR